MGNLLLLIIFAAFVLSVIADAPRPLIRWTFFVLAVLGLTWPTGAAWAQTAAGGTSISLGPIFAIAQPYIVDLAGLVITAAIAWVAAAFQRWTGIKIDQAHRDALQGAAMNAVAAELSKLQTPANALTIDVKNQVVAASIVALEKRVPDALAHFGLTPEKLGDIVEAKIGLLAHAAPTATAVAVAPPAVSASAAPAASNIA